MPGPAMHHLIADRLKARIESGSGLGGGLSAGQYAQLQTLLADPHNLPYLFLGCQGPDFFFFNTKDMNPALGELAEISYDVYEFMGQFKKDMLALVPPPVITALDEASHSVISSSSTLTELKETFEEMQLVVDALSGTMLEAVKKFISEFNLFDVFEHPYRDGVPITKGVKPIDFDVFAERSTEKNEWWWFDVMHYRKTGKFARALLEGTDPSSPLHLYAIGYLTHVAADTVGHPFVNLIAGGPYRSHAQRHKASENFQDVYNFRDVRNGADWNYSALHALYNFNYRGKTDTEHNIPDSFTNLPADLAELIANTLNKIYCEDAALPSPEYAKKLTAKDVNNTYRGWYAWFKNATDTGTLPLPVRYSFSAELRQVWDKAMDNLGKTGDFIEDAANKAGSKGIWAIFYLLAALVLAALAAAAALLDAVLGALTTLGSATIRGIACLIYDQLYNAYQSFRLAVAMNGLAFPMVKHLEEYHIKHFANPSFPDTNGKTALDILGRTPLLKWNVPGLFHNDRHLLYPPPPINGPYEETPSRRGAPDSYLDKFSTWYAWGEMPLNPNVLDELLALTPEDDTKLNDDGTKLKMIVEKPEVLGNALDLSQLMYDKVAAAGDLPDFNLDADRGYGYLCWSQEGDPAPDFPNPIVVRAKPEEKVKLNFIR